MKEQNNQREICLFFTTPKNPSIFIHNPPPTEMSVKHWNKGPRIKTGSQLNVTALLSFSYN